MNNHQHREIIAKLREILNSVKPSLPLEIPETDHFKRDWGLDSLDLVEYIARIEREYKITVKNEELEKFTSLQNIATFIEEKLNQK